MATPEERVTAIITALRNETATNQQMLNIAEYCIDIRRSEIIEAELDPDNLTNTQKARVILDTINQALTSRFKNAKRDMIWKEPDNAAALAAVGDDIAEQVP